ncbi:MAG: ATP-binding protein [Bacilli bacterium]|nr:ATP-binding protein [Bacilli bacterium]
MNLISFTTNVVCLIFCGFLAIIYFIKKNMGNMENKIYSYLIITDMLVLVFHLLYISFAYIYGDVFISRFVERVHNASQTMWYVLFFYYNIIIINENNDRFNNWMAKYKKKIVKYGRYFCIIAALITVILPMKAVIQPNGILQYWGISVDFIYGLGGVLIFLGTIDLIRNWKDVKKIKTIPFFFLLMEEAVILTVTLTDPTTCIYTLAVTSISYLMYHTIENPDINLIAQLQLAKTQAEKSNRAKTDFLSSMSHELRTPLNAILGLAQIIDTSDDLDEIHVDNKDIIISSMNLLDILNGILDISRIEANEMDVIESRYNFKEELDKVIKIINLHINDKSIEFRKNISEDLPTFFYGDSNKVKQIIMNLLTNAVKYTESGYVELAIDVEVERSNAKLTIIVTDTGRGIEEAQLNTIFTKFQRLDSDKNTTIGGTGLGLAITKSLVDMLDGKIEVESTYGKGSTFTVTLHQRVVD